MIKLQNENKTDKNGKKLIKKNETKTGQNK